MSMDRIARVRELQSIEAEIRPIKRVLGTTWTRPMHEEQRRLLWLRRKATDLLMVLAWSHGRLHCIPRGKSEDEARALHAEFFSRYVEVSS